MEFITSLLKEKKAVSLPAAISYLDLQTLLILVKTVAAAKLIKITVFKKKKQDKNWLHINIVTD